MEGKKFGAGLAGGLLLGIAIIAASGGLGSFSTVFAPASQSGAAMTTTSARTEITTMTSTASQAASATTSPAYVPTGNISQTSTTATIATPGSNAQNSDLSNLFGSATGGAHGAPGSASRVQNIASQGPLTNAIVFLPVLVAFLLGAILYRASNRSGEQPGEERL